MSAPAFDSHSADVASSTELPPDVASSSQAYAARFSGPVGQFFLDRQTAGVRELLGNAPAGCTVLDVGGGHCQLLPYYLERGFRVTILGSDERSFIQAKERGFLDNPLVTTVISPLLPLAIPDNSFDIVSGIRMMAHVEDWQKLLGEMTRVSRDCILFDYASLYTVNIVSAALYPLKKRIEKTTRPFYCQSSFAVRRRLQELSLDNLETFPQFCFPMAIHRKLGNPEVITKIEAVAEKLGLTSLFGSPVLVSARRSPR